MKQVLAVIIGMWCFWGSACVQAKDLLVFAAASLKTPLDDISHQVMAEHDMTIRISYGASGTLARQMMQGAPAHVVILAHPMWMKELSETSVVSQGSIQAVASNRLVLLGAKGAGLRSSIQKHNMKGQFQQWFSQKRRVAIGEVGSVPAGVYARQALRAIETWNDAKPYIIQAPHVQAALAFAVRGEVDLAIVYESDARLAPSLSRLYAFPRELHDPILYQAAMNASVDADESEAAQAFLTALGSAQGQAVFLDAGFSPLNGGPYDQ